MYTHCAWAVAAAAAEEVEAGQAAVEGVESQSSPGRQYSEVAL